MQNSYITNPGCANIIIVPTENIISTQKAKLKKNNAQEQSKQNMISRKKTKLIKYNAPEPPNKKIKEMEDINNFSTAVETKLIEPKSDLIISKNNNIIVYNKTPTKETALPNNLSPINSPEIIDSDDNNIQNVKKKINQSWAENYMKSIGQTYNKGLKLSVLSKQKNRSDEYNIEHSNSKIKNNNKKEATYKLSTSKQNTVGAVKCTSHKTVLKSKNRANISLKTKEHLCRDKVKVSQENYINKKKKKDEQYNNKKNTITPRTSKFNNVDENICMKRESDKNSYKTNIARKRIQEDLRDNSKRRLKKTETKLLKHKSEKSNNKIKASANQDLSPVWSVAHKVKTQSDDISNDIKTNDLRNKLRRRIKKQNVMESTIKKENLRITFPNSKKIKTAKIKSKRESKKKIVKKIKLVINLVCEQPKRSTIENSNIMKNPVKSLLSTASICLNRVKKCNLQCKMMSDDTETEDIKSTLEKSNPIASMDLSFLDDFDIDEIVDSLGYENEENRENNKLNIKTDHNNILHSIEDIQNNSGTDKSNFHKNINKTEHKFSEVNSFTSLIYTQPTLQNVYNIREKPNQTIQTSGCDQFIENNTKVTKNVTEFDDIDLRLEKLFNETQMNRNYSVIERSECAENCVIADAKSEIKESKFRVEKIFNKTPIDRNDSEMEISECKEIYALPETKREIKEFNAVHCEDDGLTKMIMEEKIYEEVDKKNVKNESNVDVNSDVDVNDSDINSKRREPQAENTLNKVPTSEIDIDSDIPIDIDIVQKLDCKLPFLFNSEDNHVPMNEEIIKVDVSGNSSVDSVIIIEGTNSLSDVKSNNTNKDGTISNNCVKEKNGQTLKIETVSDINKRTENKEVTGLTKDEYINDEVNNQSKFTKNTNKASIHQNIGAPAINKNDETNKPLNKTKLSKPISKNTPNQSRYTNESKELKLNNLRTVAQSNLAMKLEQNVLNCLNKKFTVMDVIYTGKYSTIMHCIDLDDKNKYAVKISRKTLSSNKYATNLLLKLQAENDMKNYNCIYLTNGFCFDKQWCFMFDYFPKSLLQVLKNKEQGYRINQVQKLGKQLAEAIQMMKRQKIVHSDIRPSHILLNEAEDQLKLAGFDRAYYLNELVSPLPAMNSPPYRAPESILGYSAGYSVDVWALALVLYEMVTTMPLFDGVFNNNILYLQQTVLGNVPYEMITQSQFRDYHFINNSFKLRLNRTNFMLISRFQKNHKVISTLNEAEKMRYSKNRAQPKKLREFCWLIDRMLYLSPLHRLIIEDVLADKFWLKS